ncbi:MAG: hypothetical protein PHF33_05780, partial [Candidatus Delongbacteria bacterium]|nr:hypothetical protein [Candidatus Delongbacteria bacterium]
MKQRTSFVIYMIIALGVLGSGMLFNAMGTDLDVWNTFLPENYPEIFPRIRGPVGTKLELELTRNGTDSLRHSAIFDSDGAIYLENIFKDSSSIDETYNIPKGNFISTFGNNIVFPQNNQKGINNIEINVYNVKGQLVEKVPHHIQNGFVVGHFDGNGKSEGKYFFQVKNGENVFYKPFLLNKDNNS